MARQQLARVIKQIIEEEAEVEIEPSTVEEYKNLEKTCDQVLEKVRKRKNSIKSKQIGE